MLRNGSTNSALLPLLSWWKNQHHKTVMCLGYALHLSRGSNDFSLPLLYQSPVNYLSQTWVFELQLNLVLSSVEKHIFSVHPESSWSLCWFPSPFFFSQLFLVDPREWITTLFFRITGPSGSPCLFFSTQSVKERMWGHFSTWLSQSIYSNVNEIIFPPLLLDFRCWFLAVLAHLLINFIFMSNLWWLSADPLQVHSLPCKLAL